MNEKGIAYAKQTLLIIIILLLPFNLVIGRIFPFVVSFPFYVIDILLLLLGFFFLFAWRKNKIFLTPQQKYIALFLFLFFCLGIMTIFQNMPEIMQFAEENERDVVVHSMFKQIISDEPTQSVNKTVQIALSLFLFLAISVSSLKKELLLKISCIPLAIIILTNVYLVINQQDVVLDGGRAGVTIHPYGIKEIGRAYFPFVNSLLLSMYLSLFFFVVLFLFLKNKCEKTKKQTVLFGALLFFVILVLGFTKGRAALLAVFCIFLFLSAFLFIRKLVSPFPKLFFCFVGLFLFLTLLSSFFTFPIFDTIFEGQKFIVQEINSANQESSSNIDQEKSISLLEEATLREVDVDNTQAGRQTLHWPTAIVLFQNNPVFGLETGLYYYSVLVSHKEVLCRQDGNGNILWTLCPNKIQPTDISSTAHSMYLQVLAENGLVGFVFFIVILGIILWNGYKNLQKDLLSLFLFSAIICFLIQGIFFSYFEYREITYLFWLFVGLLFKKE